MSEDSVNLERSTGLAQHMDGAAPVAAPGRPSAGAAPPFVRYWHEPAVATHRNTNLAKTNRPPDTTNERVKPATVMSIFQSPISSNAVTTIELIKTEDPEDVVELQSSDDDEVVEVALPPKPTITIESSDEEPDVPVTSITLTPLSKRPEKIASETKRTKKRQKNKRRTVSASPVPSVVSSISDDFIRGDCVALNITRRPEEHNFDFNLHGADLLDSQSNNTLSQKTKKKKNKQKNKEKTPNSNTRVESVATVTPSPPSPQVAEQEQCFTTPRSKAKQKNDRTKKYSVSEQSIPNPDIYESDSNQSALTENILETVATLLTSSQLTAESPPQPTLVHGSVASAAQFVDLTSVQVDIAEEPVPIEDNLVMGNVTGLNPVSEGAPSRQLPRGKPWQGNLRTASIVPPILQDKDANEHSAPQISRNNCRAEMERFYNESWGGEDFDHYDIMRSMSRDKNLWMIDPTDRIPSGQGKRRCHHCNQVGHGYDRCWRRPRICQMCGSEGHLEPRCPKRMCLKCGSPNSIYSMSCRNCANWSRVYCPICQEFGHPVRDCPDLWRRYHSTVENNGILTIQSGMKKKEELFCSACTRRGHLAHVCYSIPYSGLPLHSPFVMEYKPLFPPLQTTPAVSSMGRYFTLEQNGDESGFKNHAPPSVTEITETLPVVQPSKISQKRVSASSITPDHSAKKRNISSSEALEQNDTSKTIDDSNVVSSTTEKVKEDVLQDCEVSNTSEVVTTAKIYIERFVMEELVKKEGSDWLVVVSAQNRVEVALEERPTTFIGVTGLPADQESFQAELREWTQKLKAGKENQPLSILHKNTEIEHKSSDEANFCKDIPHKKISLLRMLNRALAFLASDLGDPHHIYKELLYVQNHHNQLLKKKIISPKKLSNSRTKINEILKNLNMILLGQAGLAEGSQHLRELYSLHHVLTKYRKHDLPLDLRCKIGQHYHFIFNSVAREDYTDLIRKYYNQPMPGRPSSQPNNQETPLPYKSPKNKQKKIRRKQNQAASKLIAKNPGTADIATGADKQQGRSKEFTLDQIQSCQKKLRKYNVGGEETGQWRRMLLSRLSKFQGQVKKRGLFQKQYVQLDKLMVEVKKFVGK